MATTTLIATLSDGTKTPMSMHVDISQKAQERKSGGAMPIEELDAREVFSNLLRDEEGDDISQKARDVFGRKHDPCLPPRKDVMNADRIIAIHDELHEKSRKLMVDKNHDYAGVGGDALSNFKGAAKELGLNGLEVWGVHFYKQVSALMSLVRKGCLKAESVESRVLDIRNYTALLVALIEDGKEMDTEVERCPSCSSTHICEGVCKTCGTDLVACVGSEGE